MNPTVVTGQPSDVSFQHFSTQNGLSNDQVTAILKDRRGFMWFGTVNGLNRFDGVKFTVYKRNERPDGLPGNYIVSDGLAEDRDGFIWVSTHRGLCRYDPKSDRFLPIALPQQQDQLADNDFVSPVHFDQAGIGWFASVDHIYRLDPRTRQLAAFPVPAVHPGTYPIPLPDRQGHIWVWQWGAVYRLDLTTRQYTHFLGSDPAHPNEHRQVERLTEQNGRVYTLLTQGEVCLYDSTTDRFNKQFNHSEVSTDLVEDRLPDGQPLLWLGGYNRIMAYVPATKRFTEFTHVADDPLSYPGGSVGVMWADRQTGIVWIGTSEGIAKIDPVALKFSRKWLPNLSTGPPEPVEIVRQDTRNDSLYWVLGHQMLYQWDRQSGLIRAVLTKPNMANRRFYSMLQDRQGRLWIGMQGGIAVYNPGTEQWQTHTDLGGKDNPTQLTIPALCQGADGRIWIGTTASGLFWYDTTTNQFHRWLSPGTDQLPMGIGLLQPDPSGRIWANTRSGLFRLNPITGQTKRIALRGFEKNVQPSDQIHSTFLVDKQGKLWVSGIDFLVQADTNGQIQQTYTLPNGLRADHVFGITEDKQGHLWLATDEQLHELNPKTRQFRYYNESNGLFSNTQFKTISIDRQGALITGFFGAFAYWKPENLRLNRVPPPVVITHIRVNNQPRSITSAIRLEPDETTLAIDFAALSFSQPEKNRYAYQLVDFDTDWIVTNERTATYTNLEPGNYTFRVKAANNDGVWNETGVTLPIRVVPPYWKTVWFRLLAVFVILGILYSIYRNREQQRQHVERIRDRIATDLHDDMGSTLSSIRIFSDVVQQQIAPTTPEAIPVLQRISTSATALSESMQDIIWTIQTTHDRLEDVVSRMREFGLKMAEAKGIMFRMDVSDQFEKTRLNVEQRRNLYLIFKESMNNAVKYAEPSRIEVSLTINTGKQLRLTIKDDGRGFDPATVQTGNGLPNLQKRAFEIGGSLTLTSKPGAGTSIELLTKL
ncbi:sensor histidine kinase [Spirosoma humi]